MILKNSLQQSHHIQMLILHVVILLIQAAHLAAILRRSETERAAAATRRGQRLANFKHLQECLLHPPLLDSSSVPGLVCECEMKAIREMPQSSARGTMTQDSFIIADNPTRRDRAQKAHCLAARTARAEGSKVCEWADWTIGLTYHVVAVSDSTNAVGSHTNAICSYYFVLSMHVDTPHGYVIHNMWHIMVSSCHGAWDQ